MKAKIEFNWKSDDIIPDEIWAYHQHELLKEAMKQIGHGLDYGMREGDLVVVLDTDEGITFPYGTWKAEIEN